MFLVGAFTTLYKGKVKRFWSPHLPKLDKAIDQYDYSRLLSKCEAKASSWLA